MKNIRKWKSLREKKNIILHTDCIVGSQANFFKLVPLDLYYIKSTDTILSDNSIHHVFF